MIVVSESLRRAMRARMQPTDVRLRVYDADRLTLLETVTRGVSFALEFRRNRPIRVAATIDVESPAGMYSPDPAALAGSRFWADKWIGIEIGYRDAHGVTEYVGLGMLGVSSATPSLTQRGHIVRVRCESGEKRMQVAFGAPVVFDDVPTVSDDWAKTPGVTVTASSYLAHGHEIQHQAAVTVAAHATVGGIRRPVPLSEDFDSRNMVDGDPDTIAELVHDAPADSNYAALDVAIVLDLGAHEVVASVLVSLQAGDIAGQPEMSDDGRTWEAFQPGPTRYLRVRAVGAQSVGAPPGMMRRIVTIREVLVTSGVDHWPGNAVDDDAMTAWRPAPSDLTRQIVVDFGEPRQWNQMLLGLGTNDRDPWHRCDVEVASLPDPTTPWKTISRETGAAGYHEIALPAAISSRAVRLRVLGRTGIAAIRDIVVRLVQTSNAISRLVTDIAIGEAATGIQHTWRHYPYPLGYQASDERLAAIHALADTIGWEYFVGPTDEPVFRPEVVDPSNPVWTFRAGEALLESVEIDVSAKEIVNCWRVVGATAQSRPVSATVMDDRYGSPTSVQRLGVLYGETFDALCDSEDKCRARGAALLRESTKLVMPVQVAGLAIPIIEAGDVITLDLPELRAQGAYVVDGGALSGDASGSLTMTLDLVLIPR